MKPTYFLFLMVGGIFYFACQKPPIDYATALATCKPDTIRMVIDKDTIVRLSPGIKCIIGSQLPEFSGLTMDGKKIDHDYLKGKVSVFNFWFIGCMPCEAEMPGFNRLTEKYKSSPVNFLAISRNSPKDIKEFLEKNPFTMDHIAYGEPLIVENFKHIWGYPTTIVADKHMKILFAKHGGRTDSLAISEIQKELIPIIDEALEGS
ncbi:MAG TPA: TlpA disulfide reductase family protein [Saprospiraceae bacterium]|nr:TlpA disulfide reductase family protein [Saprospiraceae bacterium]